MSHGKKRYGLWARHFARRWQVIDMAQESPPAPEPFFRVLQRPGFPRPHFSFVSFGNSQQRLSARRCYQRNEHDAFRWPWRAGGVLALRTPWSSLPE